MKVAIIYNKNLDGVINQFGMQNKEIYNPNAVKMVAESLEKGGHNVRVIDGSMEIIENLKEFMPRVIEGEKMGMVFNMAYGIQGESRYTHLPSMLEMLGIPYVGSGPQGHALALDKVITKIIMQKHGISTPDFWVYSSSKDDMSDVSYPVIVKPKMEAVSYGLRVVDNEEDLRDAVDLVISEFKQQALAEQFIPGREFCVGLLGNCDPEAFPVLEIDLEGDPCAIQTVEDKMKKPKNKICPAKISKELSDEMVSMSKEAFRALGLRDFARVDIRMDMDENIYLLEINSMASLGLSGSYVNSAKVAGYDYTSLINKIVDVASVRYFSENIIFQDELTNLTKGKLSLPVRIRGFLRTRQNETEKLLEKMVNINSHVRNVEGVNTLGNLISQKLRNLGFDSEVISQVEIGNALFFKNSRSDEYDLLFVGHLDNPTSFKKQVNFHEAEQKLYGTGIWDNKGGLAVMISALSALRFLRLLRKMKIGILLTTDNTLHGKIIKEIIWDISSKSNFVLGLSGASLDGSVITSRSSAATYKCQMNLFNAENAGDVAEANLCFSRLLSNLTKISNEDEGVVVVPREVKMKSDIASLYSHCEASFSVRFNSEKDRDILDKKIKQTAKRLNGKKNRIQIEGGIYRPPMESNQNTDALYKKVKEIGDRLDIRILNEHRWSSSDICSTNPKIVKIDGLGPMGDAPFDNEEFILRHSLLDKAALISILLYNLLMEGAHEF